MSHTRRSLALLLAFEASALGCLIFSLGRVSALGWTGLGWLGALLVLTLVAGRFTLPLLFTGNASVWRKSVADAFILLALLTYGAGAATLLAAADGLHTSRTLKRKRLKALSVSAAAVTTFVAGSVYLLLSSLWLERVGAGPGLSQQLLLIPLSLLAFAQSLLRTGVLAAFVREEAGESLSPFRGRNLVWTGATQLAFASAAALFHAASMSGGLTHLFAGSLIVSLVYAVSRLSEEHAEEARRAEAEKLRHAEEMAALHMSTIESLAIAIDAKDQTTHGHVRRTQIYAVELGRMLGVSAPEEEALKAGALLHDVGKLAVPEYILNKPGKLTAAEFEKMKTHTVVGADIIRRVNFPFPVEEIVRHHHEKWDGTGYPVGLCGEQIPLVARIISVVDFYDATRCDRPYRVGMERHDSLKLLKGMAGSSFDPRVVEKFIANIDHLDTLIAEQDKREQVSPEPAPSMTGARPDAGLAPDEMGATDHASGFRSITEAQREVAALHEIAQTIGASLNLQDTLALVASKLGAIVPSDTCVVFVVDERTGKARAAHASGVDAEFFAGRSVNVGEGITGWVIANARTMCNTSPELDMAGVPEDIAGQVRGVLVSPLVREDGAFGAVTLYSRTLASYTAEHVRLLESVCLHASSAIGNALMFERTKESALTDPLTGLPNARALHLMLEQRVAECQRHGREPISVLSLNIDDFKEFNSSLGHGVGDRILASVAGVIKRQMRQMDVLARQGGDEFIAIMPTAPAEVAALVAERIRAAVESHQFPVRTGRSTRLGISIGVSCFPADGEIADDLLAAAARNMRLDKSARKVSSAASSLRLLAFEGAR
ncbi:MAG TPA: diguanylate cyclase [Pyrinomonadaceae bacterium]|nr:diguanylate cyclase [Pyrinomonadaceae bacterium]